MGILYQIFQPSFVVRQRLEQPKSMAEYWNIDGGMIDVDTVRQLFDILHPVLNERDRRLVVAAGAMAIGYGGVSEISRATSVCRETIANGVKELREPRVLQKAAFGGREEAVRKPFFGTPLSGRTWKRS